MRRIVFCSALAAALGCGGSSSYGNGGTVSSTGTDAGAGDGGTATGFVITISNLSFAPLNLPVPPGATVTVVNKDGMPHSVTSEATSGSYTPGAPAGLASFDTGEFSSGSRTFTVPANATAGTVLPYYCTAHKQTMATPNGTLTIDPNAQPSGAGAQSKEFTVTLSPANETPPCANAAPGATGTARVTIPADDASVSVAVTYSGLSGPATLAHIHSGTSAAAGPVVLPFPGPLASPYSTTLTAANYVAPAGAPPDFATFVTALKAGGAGYVNFHTAACPAGEIRGEIQ